MALGSVIPLREVGQHGGAAFTENGACGVGRGKWPWWEEEECGGQV